jgi:hypothetical protein
MLQDPEGLTTGRLDTRYQGPDLDPLSEEAQYDPQSNAISSAYTTAINQYLRTELKYGRDWTYKPEAYADGNFSWDLRHQTPGGPQRATGRTHRAAGQATGRSSAAGRQVPPSRGPRRGAIWGNGRCDGARWGARRVR